MSTAVLIFELWVLIHCRQGYLLFKNLGKPLFLGVFFGKLGHYDTFSDVTNAAPIIACAMSDPEYYSWFEIKGHRFSLGTDLGTHMKIGLLLIVVLQAAPGIVLLFRKQWMPIALKLNELTLTLTAMEQELK